METFFKVVGWATAAILGAAVWNVFPEYRTIISSILVALFICYVFSVLVEVTIRRLIGDELLELRLQTNATADRLELIDRKVTAVLRDALEQRQVRTQTLPFRSVVSARTPDAVRPRDSIESVRNQTADTVNQRMYREQLGQHLSGSN
ncbi:hypothetical protein J6524_36125 [Bradyrhizobium sp. WSM 1738]|uniref:hypothetical protein n=1 Tax=Bradyrhizobium hereditatis TaxID=2821405 RepID=UPI001CE2F5A6|nr:hypothetical protein [Bradyrhizobium hereditatis]MCA6120219.1 hypothetical protein [Bradyrhizobium hereditatis]